MKLDRFLQKIISGLFSTMFFLVPLFFVSSTSELFEFNKIILVYAFSSLIAGVWISRIILQKKLIFQKSFLDIPLLLFLFSQFISTLFSIDTHTSIFGYYSRFNGGLLSTISYLVLYWAFVSNCDIEDVKKSIKFSLISGAIISIYGIFEHLGHSFSCLMFGTGFNVSCWVQKVQERVFATLGQPNWLAAYLAVLIPISWIFTSKKGGCHSGLSRIDSGCTFAKSDLASFTRMTVLSILFFSCLLFTQSRSGFLGFLLSFIVFWGILFLTNRYQTNKFIKPFLILNSIFLILIIIFGSPFSQINKYFTFTGWRSSQNIKYNIQNTPTATSLDGGISESGDIRKIVWKGALEIFKHYPVFGSGVETFAYSYYNFRPIEHNLVSEWDFLYNKAHNEYLNYLSTTGLFGLGSYLLFIIVFTVSSVKAILLTCYLVNQKKENNKITIYQDSNLIIALFSGWLSLLVTNFFGFSVVVTSLYFFLIPAFVVILNSPQSPQPILTTRPTTHNPLSILLFIPLFSICYLLFVITNLWRADFFYNNGLKLVRQEKYQEGYESLYKAFTISPNEPVISSELSSVLANLAYISAGQKQSTDSADFFNQAVSFSDLSIISSPNNLNLFKTRIKVFYTLSNLNPDYLPKTIETVLQAVKLAPTDPKLIYNLGLLYGKQGLGRLAVETIEKSIEMEPNYVDARNALAIFYNDLGEKQKALDQLEILIKLAPENKETFEKQIDSLF